MDGLKLRMLVCVFMEACIFLNRWSLSYYIFPLSWILVPIFASRRKESTYLVDFACLRPHPSLRVPFAALLEHLSIADIVDKDGIGFMAKVIESSGQGQETCLPLPLHYLPPKTQLEESVKEAESLLFPALADLLSKTGLSARDVDVLVVTCSGFCPSPSLSSLVLNRFRMRRDAMTFNLSGMGCSAGAAAVDLASTLLKVHSRLSYAVVLSAEILSTGWYSGKDRRKLILNCTFRMGSAALLLTNREEARRTSKYRLSAVVRTHYAYDDRAYNSAKLEEDSCGIPGFSIDRDLLLPVGEVVRANAGAVGRCVLPLGEKVRYVIRRARSGPGCVPDFARAVQHYCIPPVGRATIREIGRGLGLRERDVEAALATQQRFGNQSASSMFYQLSYIEAKERVGKGDKVWMIAMGSGLKCNSLVWECMRKIEGEADKGPWLGSIDHQTGSSLPPPSFVPRYI